MDMTPQEIAGTTFRVVKRGYDPEEVRSFQVEAARALEAAQTQAALMEQRARAAVAKAQGLAASMSSTTVAPQESGAVTASAVSMRADDAEIISRTLVLAQRTAEQTISDATRQAAEIRAAAEADAHDVVEQARTSGARLVSDARAEARRAGEAERARVANEIQALLARLEFLRGDVQEMERYADAHRARLVAAAEQLRQLADQPAAEFAEIKRPVLSPAADALRDDTPVSTAPVASIEDLGMQPLWDDADDELMGVAPAHAVAQEAPVVVVAPAPDDDRPSFADRPTGEIPAIRPTSGPVSVPDLDDDWDDATVTVVPRRGDLHIVED